MKLQSSHYRNVFTDPLRTDPRSKHCEPLFYRYYFAERGEIFTCNLLYLLNTRTLKNLRVHYNAAISKTPDKAKLASHSCLRCITGIPKSHYPTGRYQI